ncbi:Soluble inorganic pyrophosphatase, partial [Linum perenne]
LLNITNIRVKPPMFSMLYVLFFILIVVEITKGSKVKYELDKKTGMIKVSKKDGFMDFIPPALLKTFIIDIGLHL